MNDKDENLSLFSKPINPMTPREIMRKRLREYGEPIATTPKLREALNDDQANELIDWGMTALQKWVEETVDQSDSEVRGCSLARRKP